MSVKVKFADALPAEVKPLEVLRFERARITMHTMDAREAIEFLNQISQYDQQVYLAAEEVGDNRGGILRQFPSHPAIRERCKSYAN